jgi:hypothetical protein
MTRSRCRFEHTGDKYADLISEALRALGFAFEDVRFVLPEYGAPAAVALTEAEALDAADQARQLLSTKARPIALEDVIVAMRLEGAW